MSRDDFPLRTKEALAKRVGYRCSNPACGKLTSGPHADPTKAVNIGVAAHIAAAAPGGPRFDPDSSSERRSSFENGVWLCQNCGKLVDSVPDRYTVKLLESWKERAEERALRALSGTEAEELPQPASAKHTPLPRLRWLPYEAARRQLIEFGWHPVGRHWSDRNSADICSGNGPYFWALGFTEIQRSLGTGAADCVFLYRDAYGHLLYVNTQGEVDPENGSDAVVMSWTIREPLAGSEGILTDEATAQNGIVLRRPRTPPNLLTSVPLRTPSEKVRALLGTPDAVETNLWRYQFEDTQVEVAFDSLGATSSLVIALISGAQYYIADAPFGDFLLGAMSLQDLIELGHTVSTHRDSHLTKELIVHVVIGPMGGRTECFFGALVVHTGVGHLADTSFDWDEERGTLRSAPTDTVMNWVGISESSLDPPSFSWFITRA